MNVPINEVTLLLMSFGLSKVGLASSVQYQLKRSDQTILQDWINTGVYDLGSGAYAAPYTFTVVGAYTLMGRELTEGLSTNIPAVYQVIDPATAENLSTALAAIKASTDRIPRVTAEED